MLVEFKVKNFRSFEDEVTFSMVGTKDQSFADNFFMIPPMKKDPLLKVAGIFGANASGKTNVLLAINRLSKLVKYSHRYQVNEDLPFEPFKLNKECLSKPTRFAVTFIVNDIIYNYNLAHNRNRILEENLYYYPHGHKAIIFERNVKSSKEFKFTIDVGNQTAISKRTLPNTLYLSKAALDNYAPIGVVFEWFSNTLKPIGPTDQKLVTSSPP
ncbi:MAG: hypothetical protein CVT48_06105 [Thermoplasmata archaeon HGW-Thermoplasmata-1]|nr:MAG: hypothetical protein CVT48_06105 [Thermoplasmata archaeon HGW-Thermoplasmata-1]